MKNLIIFLIFVLALTGQKVFAQNLTPESATDVYDIIVADDTTAIATATAQQQLNLLGHLQKDLLQEMTTMIWLQLVIGVMRH